MNSILESKIALLPDKPGSYQMKDKDGTIIYVGKAKSLLKRVKQYFTRPQEGKVQKMVSEIEDFDIIETSTEKEAFLLEINLIQKYYPKFNILLKDGKMYPYIALKKGDDPFLKISHRDKDKRFHYFGPFPSSHSAYTMIDLLNKIFPLRKCQNIPKKPCLYYYLGQCLGPCINKISFEDNQKLADRITRLLNGDTSEVNRDLTKKMKEAAEKLNFEEAQEYKKQLDAIEHIVSSQKIMMQDHLDRDILGYSLREGYLSIIFFLYRKGVLLGKNLFVIEVTSDIDDLLTSAVFQFYLKHPKPKELVVSNKSIQPLLEESLGIKVVVPQRGFKRDLLFMALENAKQGLDQHFQTARLEDDKLEMLETLGKMLNIKIPLNIELYDNSHLQGSSAIGAMVKFVNGEKAQDFYRKYNIRSENTKDDLSSMREVLTRRFTRMVQEKQKQPDLIILDGGEEQVLQALEVEKELDIHIPIAGLKKNDKHETEALINGQTGGEIHLDHRSNLFFLLMRMQDEVHRFAISSFRKKHQKSLFQTIYDDIPGIGKKRKAMLLSAYPTLESIKDASIEELTQFIPRESAEILKDKIKRGLN